MAEAQIAEVQVSAGAAPGQGWRCSENFALRPPAGTLSLRFETTRPQEPIVFGMAKDVRFGHDDVKFEMLKNGHGTFPVDDDNLYFGGVIGATDGFRVRVIAVLSDH